MADTLDTWLQIIVSVTTLLAFITTLIMQIRAYANIRKIEIATNSMKDALVAATAKAAGLEGERRGREDEIARQGPPPT